MWGMAIVIAFLAGAGGEASRDDCAVFLEVSRPPERSSARWWKLLRCMEGLRGDVSWVIDDLDATTEKGNAAAGRHQRMTDGIARLAQLETQRAQVQDAQTQKYIQEDARQTLDRISADLEGRSGGATAGPEGWRFLIPRASQPVGEDGGRRSLPDARTYALHAREALGRLTSLVETATSHCMDDEGCDHARNVQQGLKRDVYGLLSALDMQRPLVAALVPAVGFARSDGDVSGTQQTAAATYVRFESRHLSLAGPLDVGLLGHFGVQSAFNMATPPKGSPLETASTRSTRTVAEDGSITTSWEQSSTVRKVCRQAGPSAAEVCNPAPDGKPIAKLQTAFTWDIGARAGFAFHDWAELSFIGRAGQIHTAADFTTVDLPSGPALAAYADAGAENRWYTEYGARFSLFKGGSGVRAAHDLGLLRPLLEAEYAWREDRRFKGFGIVDGKATFGDHPERRQWVRLALQRLSVLGADDKTFTMSFSVEHEWSRGPGLPAATRIYLQGDLDLGSAFFGKARSK